MVKPGVYKHFKGACYIVIGVAMHTGTQEEHVVYKTFNGKLFVRPLKEFIGPRGDVPRFVKLTGKEVSALYEQASA